MEVVAATPNGTGVPPFHNHDVREWSRIDSLTGVLERARLETDHWTANTATASHKYGKVVDCRARSAVDGALHQAKRQLEVYQSHIPGGHLQVVKTHTVSSSRWSNKTIAEKNTNDSAKEFEDLELSLHPLDISSQKSKASVGRSVGRRPPSRPRTREETSFKPFQSNLHQTASTNLQRVSRLCHQVHENAVKQAFGSYSPKRPIQERENGDGSVEIFNFENHRDLTRAKSTSSEDINLLTPEKDKSRKSIEDLEDLEQLQNWRRTSKIRRSLQFPKQNKVPAKPDDLPDNKGNVRKIREDLETGRRLSTALRGNNVDLEALDQILQSISGSSASSNTSEDKNEPDKELIPAQKQKRNSFVTVESLQEVKGRLRRTSSPTNDIYQKEEEIDDGIGTEGSSLSLKQLDTPKSRVRSYVYGMEAMLNKKPIVTTGSLESKSKLSNGTSTNRNEDWYNRRKSYGFEQVNGQQDSSIQSSRSKTRVESSTDSGICRSTEIVTPKANVGEYGISNVKKFSSLFEQKENTGPDWKSTKITIPIVSSSPVYGRKFADEENKRHSIAVDESKYVNRNTDNKFRRTSLAINDPYDDPNEDINRKPKKVEFCKTEVHFAADSGKVNIVETDEKPPPTNNFRRRRKNIGFPANLEDFNRNGLPVLHFGDSSYEKSLLGLKDLDSCDYNYDTTPVVSGNVTVNSNNYYNADDRLENYDAETPRGILKNKPIKPKPYHLGLSDEIPSDPTNGNTWGVKLKPVQKEETPIWRSTVTVRNTFYDKPATFDTKPELSDEEEKLSRINIISPTPDLRRSSWSVADRIKQVEDLQWTENKGYSTKVNFGNGEATVVENNSRLLENGRQTTWPRREGVNKDSEKTQILNKGLVVRIGRENSNSKHTVCSKTTTNGDSNSTTTTTKITIDLSPSPMNTEPVFDHEFKSTSLILNTIKNEEKTKITPKKTSIPQQLEALRKLYEDVMSDTEADREVQSLMSRINEKELSELEDDTSSVVSGSWSKLRAFKNVTRCVKKSAEHSVRLGSHAQIEKDLYVEKPNKHPDFTDKPTINFSITKTTEERNGINARTSVATPTPLKTELSNRFNPEKLSSPSLVGLNKNRNEFTYDNSNEINEFSEINKKVEKASPKVRRRSPSKESVLRQPKKSEMAYFGLPVSPKPAKREPIKRKDTKLTDKPDLLQHHEPKTKNEPQRTKSPIYMNLEEVQTKTEPVKREFDASILEELTKAADQILQAVNGYTDDDSHQKQSTDEEKSKKWSNKTLDTISETKSWNRSKVVQTKTSVARTAHSKSKLKPTSSTSSVESITRECRKPAAPVRKSSLNVMSYLNATASTAEKAKKKPTNADGATSAKAITKARRLQRASSREALLQSHGSSSEDLPANIQMPVRKPRLVKKTKTTTTQFSITNGLEMNKKSSSTVNYRNEDGRNKNDDRIPTVGVPEIRHKTAVSTIRSTAERVASRTRTKPKLEEQKRRASTAKVKDNRAQNATPRSDKSKSVTPTKETASHRISTANIKKCSRMDGLLRH